MSIASHVFTIINDKGLHARASARFVEVVEKFESEVTVEKDGLEASGSSIMGLLMLAASIIFIFLIINKFNFSWFKKNI